MTTIFLQLRNRSSVLWRIRDRRTLFAQLSMPSTSTSGTLNSPVRDFEKTRTEFQEILAKPIRELGLKLEGSPLERFVQQLYRELEAKGVHKFRPLCYLTDEWGCPSGEPVVGIPFYLANPDLAQLERDMNDLEDAREIMMYM